MNPSLDTILRGVGISERIMKGSYSLWSDCSLTSPYASTEAREVSVDAVWTSGKCRAMISTLPSFHRGGSREAAARVPSEGVVTYCWRQTGGEGGHPHGWPSCHLETVHTLPVLNSVWGDILPKTKKKSVRTSWCFFCLPCLFVVPENTVTAGF